MLQKFFTVLQFTVYMLQKFFTVYSLRYKSFLTVLKLQKNEVLKLQKIEFMRRFYKQLFYSIKTAKKLLMGMAISYFIILLPLPLPLFKKTHFFSFRMKKKLARSEREMLF